MKLFSRMSCVRNSLFQRTGGHGAQNLIRKMGIAEPHGNIVLHQFRAYTGAKRFFAALIKTDTDKIEPNHLCVVFIRGSDSFFTHSWFEIIVDVKEHDISSVALVIQKFRAASASDSVPDKFEFWGFFA